MYKGIKYYFNRFDFSYALESLANNKYLQWSLVSN